jgi:16S rRNA processing protein RimM
VRLLETGSAVLLVVEGDDQREVLIPFVDEICTEVDVDARRIIINPPDGLLEL